MDVASQEFQEILNIKPVKVKIAEKKEPQTDEPKEEYDGKQQEVNIFSYFHLPEPRKCAPDVIDNICTIAKALQTEARDNDEFYMLLKAIDSKYKSDDTYRRIDNISRFVKMTGRRLRRYIEENRLLSKDILADEARDNGDWRFYLKYVAEKQKEVER